MRALLTPCLLIHAVWANLKAHLLPFLTPLIILLTQHLTPWPACPCSVGQPQGQQGAPPFTHALELPHIFFMPSHCCFPSPAVSANLKAGGAPELLSALLEGESLFNDASGLVLFDVFLVSSRACPLSAWPQGL